MHMIATLEQALGRKARKELLPMQPGDVPATYADVEDLTRDVGFTPATPIEDGIARLRARGIGSSTGFRTWRASECLPRACPEDPAFSTCRSLGDGGQ